MDIDKHNEEQEKKDIEMFLAKVDEWNKKIDRKDSISVCSIWDYLESLLEACCSTTTTDSSQHNLPSIPDQMLDHTGKISSEIAWNAMNNVDSHNSTLSVINILEQFSWEAKVALSIASYILTYGNNGLNLSFGESKLVASDDELLDFSRKLIKMEYLNTYLKNGYLSSFIKSEDPRFNNGISSLLAVYYSIIRVIVVAASSHLLTRSSRESNDRFDTSTVTWCSKKLDIIQDQLDSAADEILKVRADSTPGNNVWQENENEHELIRGYPLHECAPENIDINVVGDTLVLNVTYNDRSIFITEKEIDEDKYEKEGITAEWNKGWVYITVPKRKPKPQHIHIPLRITS